jgi:hypothetical protein
LSLTQRLGKMGRFAKVSEGAEAEVRPPLKRHTHTDVKYKQIFPPLLISIRVECKINPGRPYWQEILQTETDARSEIFEILVERV